MPSKEKRWLWPNFSLPSSKLVYYLPLFLLRTFFRICLISFICFYLLLFARRSPSSERQGYWHLMRYFNQKSFALIQLLTFFSHQVCDSRGSSSASLPVLALGFGRCRSTETIFAKRQTILVHQKWYPTKTLCQNFLIWSDLNFSHFSFSSSML